MVKRSVLTKKPKKTAVITRAQVKSIDHKYIGDEPIDVSIKGYASALNWYNYMFDVEQARVWLLEYTKREGYPKDVLTAIKNAPKYAIPTTVGWISRILMNGNDISESTQSYFKTRISEIAQSSKKDGIVDDSGFQKETISIQDRVKQKANSVITDIEGLLDEQGLDFSIYSYAKSEELTPSIINHIKDYYIKVRDELNADDDQVSEAFGKKLKSYRNFWNEFINDCDRFINNTKAVKVRKPREKKVKSAVDLVKNMKFQKEFPALKIVSINPAEIVGASSVWVYNSKYRKLTQYNSVGPAGLSVKGSSIVNFDNETSTTKTVRKPELVINELLKAGKVALRRVMDDIKTNETKPTGRINEDVVIIRVSK